MAELSTDQKRQLALGIYENGLLNFGEFTFKSGIKSPMYMNLRNLLSYPKFLKEVAKMYATVCEDLEFDRLGAIPYGAISMTGALSLELDVPWICARKESKDYGMAKDLIGDFNDGETVLMIDDLVTNGESKVESLVSFQDSGLIIKDFVVMLDYDRGATKLLADQGYKLHSMMTVKEAVDILNNEGKLESEMYERVISFLESTK